MAFKWWEERIIKNHVHIALQRRRRRHRHATSTVLVQFTRLVNENDAAAAANKTDKTKTISRWDRSTLNGRRSKKQRAIHYNDTNQYFRIVAWIIIILNGQRWSRNRRRRQQRCRISIEKQTQMRYNDSIFMVNLCACNFHSIRHINHHTKSL